MNKDATDFIVVGSIFAYLFGLMICSEGILPHVRGYLRARDTPNKAINAVAVFMMLVAPLSVLAAIFYWVVWMLFYLGVAFKYALPKLPKRKSKLPVAAVLERKH